jgi:hypothetical protein
MRLWVGVLAAAVACGCGGRSPFTGGPVPPQSQPAPPPTPKLHTLSVAPQGEGTVTSNPQGISCPGACAASFVEGTAVTLTAVDASAGEEFLGWGGTCAGANGCVVAMAGDARVTAMFGDPCAALMPSLPSPETVQMPFIDEDLTACGVANTDGDGNVYLYGSSLEGTTVLDMLQSGFTFVGKSMAAVGPLVAAAPDGTEISTAPMSGYLGAVDKRPNGGVIVAEPECFYTHDANVQMSVIDDFGGLAGQFGLADLPCLDDTKASVFDVPIDAQDHMLVMSDLKGVIDGGLPAGSYAARWYDLAGQPMSNWFVLPSFDGGGLVALPGGGFAVRIGSEWTATLRSGATTMGPAPDGLLPNKWANLVLAGKAWAMVPSPGAGGTIDIVTARGKSCGPLMTVPPGIHHNVNLGRDGSILLTNPRDPNVPGPFDGPDSFTCAVTVYRNVLR